MVNRKMEEGHGGLAEMPTDNIGGLRRCALGKGAKKFFRIEFHKQRPAKGLHKASSVRAFALS